MRQADRSQLGDESACFYRQPTIIARVCLTYTLPETLATAPFIVPSL